MDDLRIPIGAFFLLTGVILCATPAGPAPLATGRVDFYSGAAMFFFGVLMLALAWRARRASSR